MASNLSRAFSSMSMKDGPSSSKNDNAPINPLQRHSTMAAMRSGSRVSFGPSSSSSVPAPAPVAPPPVNDVLSPPSQPSLQRHSTMSAASMHGSAMSHGHGFNRHSSFISSHLEKQQQQPSPYDSIPSRHENPMSMSMLDDRHSGHDISMAPSPDIASPPPPLSRLRSSASFFNSPQPVSSEASNGLIDSPDMSHDGNIRSLAQRFVAREDRPPSSSGLVGKYSSKCSVLAWGEPNFVGLGPTNAQRASAPSNVPNMETNSVTAVAVGAFHAIVAKAEGVFSWGIGTHGALGHSDTKDLLIPLPIDSFRGTTVISLACGGMHSLAATSDGRIFAFGTGSNGELGIGEETTTSTSPVQVPMPAGFKCCLVAAGWNHSAALGIDGSVYTWGLNRFGQLGVSGTANRFTPERVALLSDRKVVQVACGRNHTLFLTEIGEVYSCGQNNSSQLGYGESGLDIKQQETPKAIDGLRGKHICSIAAGSAHSIALSAFGHVYTWGSGNAGRLGLGDSKDRAEPTLVRMLMDKKIRVALLVPSPTAFHTVVITEGGSVLVWGCGRGGVLGLRSEDNTKVPIGLDALGRDAKICLAAAGQRLSLVIHNPKSVNAIGSLPHMKFAAIAEGADPSVGGAEDDNTVMVGEMGLKVINAEVEAMSSELDRLREALSEREVKLNDLSKRNNQLSANALQEMSVHALDELESMYLEGIGKVSQAKQDAVLQEMHEREEQIRTDLEQRYKAVLAQLKKKDTVGRKELVEQQAKNARLQGELRELRAEMEKLLVQLDHKNQLDQQVDESSTRAVRLDTESIEAEKRIKEIGESTEEYKKANVELKTRVRILQEDYTTLQEQVGKIRAAAKTLDAEIRKEQLVRDQETGLPLNQIAADFRSKQEKLKQASSGIPTISGSLSGLGRISATAPYSEVDLSSLVLTMNREQLVQTMGAHKNALALLKTYADRKGFKLEHS